MSKPIIKKLVLGMVATNCYIVYDQDIKEAIIIDPAAHAEQITVLLDEHQVKAAAILLTHSHYDHIGAVEELRSRLSVDVYIHREEAELLADPNQNLSRKLFRSLFLKADVLLEDGHELNIGGMRIKVIHTPGHTKGCCCYYIEEHHILFSGDTMFYETYGRIDLPTGNGTMIMRSIQKLLALEGITKVYPGHDQETDIEHERHTYHDYYKAESD